ncbi:hypothetical protein J6894_00455 [Nakaseomyces glabratus]|nr:hypothetical protein J6894_00455 [Nakaseomyces glabratus]
MPRFHPSQQLHVLPLILDIYDIFRTLEHAASVRGLTEKERERERRRTTARGIPRGKEALSQYVNHLASGGGAQKWPEGAAYGTGSDAVRLQEGIAHAAHAAHAEPYAHDAPFLASRILATHTASTAHTAHAGASTPSHQPLSKHLCQDMSCRCQDVPRRAKTSLGRAKDKFTFLIRSQHTRTNCNQAQTGTCSAK